MEEAQFISALSKEIEAAMAQWSVKGCTVVLVQRESERILTFGKSDVSKDTDVSPHTLFALASCSKHVTVIALLRELRTRGLSINTKVKTILPSFRLYDKHAEAECTVEDILSHRTGLPGYDHLWNPSYHLSELPDRLGGLRPTAGFRERHQYNSLFYDLAAVLVERLTGTEFAQYVKEELFDPLCIQGATYKYTYTSHGNGTRGGEGGEEGDEPREFARGYWNRVTLEGEEEARELDFGLGKMDGGQGTGKLWINAEDMARWLKALPAQPEWAEMVKPRTIVGTSGGLEFPDHTVLYGLGIRVSTARGVRVEEHSGEVPGFLTRFSHLPEHGTSFALLTNSDPGGKYMRSLVKQRMVEYAAGLPRLDWVDRIEAKRQEQLAATREWLDIPRPHLWANGVEAACHGRSSLVGTWSSQGFDTWTIGVEDIVPTLPELGALPFITALYGTVRYLFAPVSTDMGETSADHQATDEPNPRHRGNGGHTVEQKGTCGAGQPHDQAEITTKYKGCFEWTLDDTGEPMYGYPFDVVLQGQKMWVFGLTGVGEGLNEDDWGVKFIKAGVAYGLSLPTFVEHHNQCYGDEFPDMHSFARHSQGHKHLKAPQRVQHRSLNEDSSDLLVPWEALANKVRVDCLLHSTLISMASVLGGRDHRQCGKNAGRLGLESISVEAIGNKFAQVGDHVEFCSYRINQGL